MWADVGAQRGFGIFLCSVIKLPNFVSSLAGSEDVFGPG